MEDHIAMDQAAGRALPGSPAQQAFVLVWAVERSLYQSFINDESDPDDVVEGLVVLFRRTIYGLT